MLSVITSSTGEELTSLAAVQEVLGAPASDEPLVERLILRASRWAETYVGQPLLAQRYLESVPGYASNRLMLSRTPVRSVSKLVQGSSSTEDGQVFSSTAYRVEDAEAGVLYSDLGFLWQPAQANEIADYYAAKTERPNYWVEYEAGYIYPGDETTGPTLPDQIEAAVIEKTVALYRRDGDVVSKRLGDFSVQYNADAADPAEAMLEPFRRLA